jgi:hypothetical protein
MLLTASANSVEVRFPRVHLTLEKATLCPLIPAVQNVMVKWSKDLLWTVRIVVVLSVIGLRDRHHPWDSKL